VCLILNYHTVAFKFEVFELVAVRGVAFICFELGRSCSHLRVRRQVLVSVRMATTRPPRMTRLLQHPPDRKPSAEVVDNAAWYSALDEESRRKLMSIIRTAVDLSVFGFLCVIDGVRAIENSPNKGRLELRYIRDKTVVLNPPDGDVLHELY
jgi:hypothetical protein